MFLEQQQLSSWLLTNYFLNSDVANVAFDMAILKSQRALANLTCLLAPGCYKHSYLCNSELKHVYLCTGCVNCALGVEYCLLHLYEWTSLKRCCDGLLPSSHCDKISEDMEFWRVVGGVFDEFDRHLKMHTKFVALQLMVFGGHLMTWFWGSLFWVWIFTFLFVVSNSNPRLLGCEMNIYVKHKKTSTCAHTSECLLLYSGAKAP